MKRCALASLGFLIASTLALAGAADAQSRIRTLPGYERWAEIAPQIPKAVKSGAITPVWAKDSGAFDYTLNGKSWRFDLTTRITSEQAPPPPSETAAPVATGAPAETGVVLARGRGADANVESPDKLHRAFSRDRNVWLAKADGSSEIQLSHDGGVEARIRNGTGSYLYLEEFSVSSPVWWSPDSRKVAWMRYDESKVEDYFLPLNQSRMQPTILTEAYPHPGAPNPIADLVVYDLNTGKSTIMDVREGAPFSDDVVGHYMWSAQWTADSAHIAVRRADRRQKIYDLGACAVATGKCRSVARETRKQSWASGAAPVFLADGKRFIWASDRTGFRNLELRNLDGKLLTRLTRQESDVGEVVMLDEAAGYVWYTARTGDNHMKLQLHRVKLNGSGDKQLTDPAFNHKVSISPDARWFLDTAQTHDTPPVTRLMDWNGKPVADIATSDLTDYQRLGLKQTEMFAFTSADGETKLDGLIDFPSDFDPAKTYPVLLSVYGGPGAAGGANETFAAPSALTEFGFLIVRLDARTAIGKGRKGLDAAYQQLGVVEMDDFAAGIKSLRSRSYVDAERVGVFGTSYGGTVAATLLMRYPDVFQAAASSSPVTDYRLYDSAYSERFLGLPETDRAAYDRAAVLSYVDGLKGDLLLYYGTSDDNVHPKNALQLIKALQAARKSFEVQVGPDRGHTTVDQIRMMEFFIERLVVDR